VRVETVGGTFGFKIVFDKEDESDAECWKVQLPHQCDEWSISAGSAYAWATAAEAIGRLERFIGEAESALTKLRALVAEHYPIAIDHPDWWPPVSGDLIDSNDGEVWIAVGGYRLVQAGCTGTSATDGWRPYSVDQGDFINQYPQARLLQRHPEPKLECPF
jgi:hypothetical protein